MFESLECKKILPMEKYPSRRSCITELSGRIQVLEKEILRLHEEKS